MSKLDGRFNFRRVSLLCRIKGVLQIECSKAGCKTTDHIWLSGCPIALSDTALVVFGLTLP